ncbi:MAG: hypothetical protein RLZZ227_2595 [Pseudomonadota bacterium]|jgi:hypothetical protein
MTQKAPAAGIMSTWLPQRLLLLCCLPAACATEAPVFTASYNPATIVERQSAEIPMRPATPVQYYSWVTAATLPELEAEYARLMERPSSADPVIRTAHIVTLLGVSALATPVTEEEALALLDIAKGSPITETNRDYAAFAAFLRGYLQQRTELRSANSAAAQSRAELEQLQTSNAELQQQIDALTTLEQQLIEREQSQEP